MENFIKELQEWIKQNTSFSEENGHSVPTIHLEKEVERLGKKYFPKPNSMTIQVLDHGVDTLQYAVEHLAASKAGLLPPIVHMTEKRREGISDLIHGTESYDPEPNNLLISKKTKDEFFKSISAPITVIDEFRVTSFCPVKGTIAGFVKAKSNTYIATRNFNFLDSQLQCNMQITKGTVFHRIVDDPTNFSDGCMIIEESIVLESDNFQVYENR